MTIGQRIKLLRSESKISQEYLAKSIGVSRSTVAMYESDKRIPEDNIKEAIADFFNVDMNYLYGKTEIKNRYYAEINNVESFSKIVGKRIQAARREAELSRFQLAVKVGLSEQTIEDMENGMDRYFDRNLMVAFAHALNVETSYFINDKLIVDDIGQNIKCLRMMSGLTVKEISERTGTPEQRIIDIENGAYPSFSEIELISKFYKIPEQWVINYDFCQVCNDNRVRLAFQILGKTQEISEEQMKLILSYVHFVLKE